MLTEIKYISKTHSEIEIDFFSSNYPCKDSAENQTEVCKDDKCCILVRVCFLHH